MIEMAEAAGLPLLVENQKNPEQTTTLGVGELILKASQKGADPEMVRRLDNGLAHFASVMQAFSGSDVSQVADSGAAGGLGAGVLTFLNGTLMPGIELLLGVLEFDQLVQSVDLVITGEGRMDGQSLAGKTPRRHRTPGEALQQASDWNCRIIGK